VAGGWDVVGVLKNFEAPVGGDDNPVGITFLLLEQVLA
jgi:hypothetical protein